MGVDVLGTDIMEVDVLGIDVMGVDVLGVGVMALIPPSMHLLPQICYRSNNWFQSDVIGRY